MMLNTLPSEYSLFVNYGRKTREFLNQVFYLYRLPKEKNVLIEYASPPRAFVKFLVPIYNGGNMNPTITFYLESPEYVDNENHLGFVYEKKIVNEKIKMVPAPLIFKLNYKITIYAATQIDADRLSYQILAYARKNRKASSKIDGQWVEWFAHSLADEGTSDPGLEDRVARRNLILTIPRAYLPVDFDMSEMIKNVQVSTMLEDEINAENN